MGYEQKVGKAYARGALRSCVVSIVGLVLGVAMLASVLWVGGGSRMSADSYRPLLALAVPLVFIGGALVLAWLFVVLRNRRLDRAFAGLGIKGHQVGGVLRGWHGEFRGRALDAWFHKGPTLELYLGCRPATRGGVARTGRLGQSIARHLTHREPLDPSPPQVPGCAVYADDAEWMRRFLAVADVEHALARLLAETGRVSPMVSVAPNAVRYMRRFGPVAELNEENVRAWLADLEHLAQAVDRLGPSASGEEPSELDEWARIRRGRRFLPRIFGCMALSLVIFWALLMAFFYYTHYM